MPTVTCPKCEKVQRVPWGRSPGCAGCGTKLAAPDRPIQWWMIAISVVLAVVITVVLVFWRNGPLLRQFVGGRTTEVPTPTREGTAWRPDQLNGYLKKKGFQLTIEDRIDSPKVGNNFNLVSADGRVVTVRQFLNARDAVAGVEPWEEGRDTFVWGTFQFTGDPGLISGIRRALVVH